MHTPDDPSPTAEELNEGVSPTDDGAAGMDRVEGRSAAGSGSEEGDLQDNAWGRSGKSGG